MDKNTKDELANALGKFWDFSSNGVDPCYWRVCYDVLVERVNCSNLWGVNTYMGAGNWARCIYQLYYS